MLKVKPEKTLRCELQPPPAPEPELAPSSFSGLEASGWEGTQGQAQFRDMRHKQSKDPRRGYCQGMGWLMGHLGCLGSTGSWAQPTSSIPGPVASVIGAMETRGGGRALAAWFPPSATAPPPS